MKTPESDIDDLPIDPVGAWATEKHRRLQRYIDASRAARRKFTQGTGGTTYIDLFCGSGRSVVRETGERIDGSPLVAFKSALEGQVPFTELHIADFDSGRCLAARQRLERLGASASTYVGPAHETIANVVRRLNPYGLHFAFLDPYNLQDLAFTVLEELSKLKRIDLLIHVSAQDLQRNLHRYTAEGDDRLETFAPGWRKTVDLAQSQSATRAAILSHWVSNLEKLGLPPAKHAELVTGQARNQRLYWLVFASKSDFAKKLWNDIRTLDGQRGLFE